MKAAIVLDNWKLPVFRTRLTEAGYTYEDAGAFTGDTTVLHVEVEQSDVPALAKVIRACEVECRK